MSLYKFRLIGINPEQMRNLYQLFGVPNFASLEEIAAAYKKNYTQLFSTDSPLANIPKLKQLKNAFELLMDDERREEYDEQLADFLEEIQEKFEEAVDDLVAEKYADAVQKLKWCISKDSGEPDYYETIGLVYRLSGDIENALKSYRQGLETGQRQAHFHKNLGEIYRLKHDDDNADTHFLEAAEEFKNILAADPKNLDAMQQLAEIYTKMKWFEEALDVYSQLIKRFPYNATFRRDIGSILYELDMLEEAEANLLESLRIKPKDAPALLFLGLVYFKRRLLAMAVETLKDCLAINSEQPEVQQLIGQIESIRNEIGKTVEEIIYDPAPDAYVEGYVKWYNRETGMGVLSCDEFPEVLLHFSALTPEVEESLSKGDPVEFGIVKDKNSPVAVQVKKLNEHSVSDALPGKIESFDEDRKVGIIRSHDGREIFFPFSALTEETIAALKPGLDVIFEAKGITGLEDKVVEQAVRVRVRKRRPQPQK
jgi:cold shock CspA family protein/Tfp pilus assembly protein PilF